MNVRLVVASIGFAAACGGSAANSPPPAATAPTAATTPATAPAAATPATAPAAAAPSTDAEQPCVFGTYDVIASARRQGGTCLEPAVLGADKAARCEAFLEQHGWQRDTAAETAIGQRTGKTLACFRSPPPPNG